MLATNSQQEIKQTAGDIRLHPDIISVVSCVLGLSTAKDPDLKDESGNKQLETYNVHFRKSHPFHEFEIALLRRRCDVHAVRSRVSALPYPNQL